MGRINRLALSKIGWVISVMETDSAKLNPPVNRIFRITKNDPFRTLVFTVLSARTKDENTMKAAGALLRVAPNPGKLASMPLKKIERIIRPSGFYRVKSRNLKAAANMLVWEFGGKVPSSLEELVLIPGVGRKTANIMLAYSFGKDAIPVDTHVHRISNRLGIARTKKPEDTEKALMRTVPRRHWKALNHAFVAYGQTVCIPRSPKCPSCRLRRVCWRIGVRANLQPTRV